MAPALGVTHQVTAYGARLRRSRPYDLDVSAEASTHAPQKSAVLLTSRLCLRLSHKTRKLSCAESINFQEKFDEQPCVQTT